MENNDFLLLAKGLSESSQTSYNGWLIGRAKYEKYEAFDPLLKYKLETEIKKEKASVIVMSSSMIQGAKVVASLTVTMMKPISEVMGSEVIESKARGSAAIGPEVIESKARGKENSSASAEQENWHVFSKEEVEKYVFDVKDTNEIHQGEYIVVPGLLIFAKLLEDISSLKYTGDMRFYHPVYADETIFLEKAKKIRGFARDCFVFDFEYREG